MTARNAKVFLCKDEEEMLFVIDTLTTNIPDLKLLKETPTGRSFYSDNEDCLYYIQTESYRKIRCGSRLTLTMYRGNVGWKTIEESDRS